MLKTLVLGGFVILVAFIVENVHSVHLNEEFSVGTSLNKYLWSPKDSADDDSTTKGQKRTAPVWFLRTGKRSQTAEGDNLPPEILEILEKVQKSPELQNILLEKLNLEGLLPLIVYLPNNHQHDSNLMMPRFSRDAPDLNQNLNSRPYPPRFGRQFGGLPPYLPRLGRSAGDSE